MIYLAEAFRELREGSRRTLRVLVADDSPVALAAICSFLESLSVITVVGTALSGYELMQKAEQLDPDLVVTDLRMPRMSGLECALHLREILPGVRIIVLTEMEGPFVRQACLESGADECVYKSEMPNDLILAIRRMFPKVLGAS